MKNLFLFLCCVSACGQNYAQSDTTLTNQTERNKQIVRDFYNDLWFSNNTDNYIKYVADEYVVHDIGDRKGVTEPAIEQKNIADFFWANGDWTSVFDYQIAEGDLVATRWKASYKPKTFLGKIAIGDSKMPIINVFRLKDGKIVEIWNHRLDIDTRQTLQFTLKGFGLGLLVSLVLLFIVIKQRRMIKKLSAL